MDMPVYMIFTIKEEIKRNEKERTKLILKKYINTALLNTIMSEIESDING
jgi:phosphopantothenate synthetase